MTDPISSISRSVRLDTSADSRTKKIEEDQGEISRTLRTPEDLRKDKVELSGVQEKAMASPAFDEEKVNRIKQAIRDGQYPLDSKRIAESFVALERVISGVSEQ
jgi:flagellar biosynthesis anti-sigma factor FlgM